MLREASGRPARAQAGQHRARSLPAPLTRLIGRASELAAVGRVLLEPHVRLLTLVGPPGVGKTRLALGAAAGLVGEFAHGLFFVPLAALADPGLVASAIAQPLGIQEFGGRPLVETLQAAIGDRELLLVLDNFEHLLAAAPLVAGLLEACPALKVLATSRAPLHVYGEHELPVPPLALPDLQQPVDPEALAEVPAVALLLERARAVRPDFALTARNAAAAAELCARLDGLPLAIELAAAHLKLLPPEAILGHLGSRLDLLTDAATGRPERHWALRAAIAWSHDLLSADEQRLLRRLAVFAGGWTLEAAEAVCGGHVLEGLASLVDKSLVQQAELAAGRDGEPRFGMLETVREYALERLETGGEAAEIRRRHAEYFVQLARAAEAELYGPRQAAWLARLQPEQANLRAVLAWLLERGAAEQGQALCFALWRFWYLRGHLAEGRAWFARFLQLPGASGQTRGEALFGAGSLAQRQGDHAVARTLLGESLRTAREIGNRLTAASALTQLGHIACGHGDYPSARSLYQEALAIGRLPRPGVSDSVSLGISLGNLGRLALLEGNLVEARRRCEEALVILRQFGQIHEAANCLRVLGEVATEAGDLAEASVRFEEGLAVYRELADPRGVAWVLDGLAILAVARSRPALALCLAQAAQAHRRATGEALWPVEKARLERRLAPARRALGERAAADFADRGRSIPLEQAIQCALSGEEADSGAERGGDAPGAEGAPLLTAREREIAGLIARGLSNRQIAEQLVLSVRTVERHIENLYTKLGVSGRVARAAVAAFALRHGLA